MYVGGSLHQHTGFSPTSFTNSRTALFENSGLSWRAKMNPNFHNSVIAYVLSLEHLRYDRS